jgi:hypothetical protein
MAVKGLEGLTPRHNKFITPGTKAACAHISYICSMNFAALK